MRREMRRETRREEAKRDVLGRPREGGGNVEGRE
jgi:hypothetical protein